jgi:GNAT superfamily N-acetyltransferase
VSRDERRAEIREARPDDVRLLAELGARTFRDTYAEATSPSDLEAFVRASFSLEEQSRALADGRNTHLVAEVGGDGVGYAVLREDEAPPGVDGTHPILLSHLYVDRPFQGTGVGAALLTRCVELGRERGHDVLWLGVWERNPRAIGFYERWGFRRAGETPFPFGAETHRDLVYALSL